MSFGYSVGDFIAIGALAWNVYKSCKGAPQSFAGISSEVLSLHAVLKEAEETVFVQPLLPARQERLRAVGEGCYGVLKDLDNLICKYQNLETQGKRTWDRMRWGAENISELRARLTSNTVLLVALISTSQIGVERKLNDYMEEIKEGKRRSRSSTISRQTVDSLCMDERQVWRTIRKELEDIGITIAAFHANKDFIFEWFANAVASGAFEEQTFDNFPNAAPHVGPLGEQLQVENASGERPGLEETVQAPNPVLSPIAEPFTSSPDTDRSRPVLFTLDSGPLDAPAATSHNNTPSLDDMPHNLVTFSLPEEGRSCTINVADFDGGIEVIEKLLMKLGKCSMNLEAESTVEHGLIVDGWSVFLDSGQQDSLGEPLTDYEIASICHVPLDHPLRQRALVLRNVGKAKGSKRLTQIFSTASSD